MFDFQNCLYERCPHMLQEQGYAPTCNMSGNKCIVATENPWMNFNACPENRQVLSDEVLGWRVDCPNPTYGLVNTISNGIFTYVEKQTVDVILEERDERPQSDI